jgi:hypothetical protein
MSHERIYRTQHNRIDTVVQLNVLTDSSSFRDAGVQLSPYSDGPDGSGSIPCSASELFLFSTASIPIQPPSHGHRDHFLGGG